MESQNLIGNSPLSSLAHPSRAEAQLLAQRRGCLSASPTVRCDIWGLNADQPCGFTSPRQALVHYAHTFHSMSRFQCPILFILLFWMAVMIVGHGIRVKALVYEFSNSNLKVKASTSKTQWIGNNCTWKMMVLEKIWLKVSFRRILDAWCFFPRS